jgi:hypothetical protein
VIVIFIVHSLSDLTAYRAAPTSPIPRVCDPMFNFLLDFRKHPRLFWYRRLFFKRTQPHLQTPMLNRDYSRGKVDRLRLKQL